MPDFHIYKITNTENGKMYIGITGRNPAERLVSHIRDARWMKKKTVFGAALCEYGLDSFSIEVVETVKSHKEVQDRERYFISKFGTLHKNGGGYNSIGGGGGGMLKSDRIARDKALGYY